MEFLKGKTYKHVCPGCQNMIDKVADALNTAGIDTQDTEAPVLFMGDHKLFCGGRECINKPDKDLEYNGDNYENHSETDDYVFEANKNNRFVKISDIDDDYDALEASGAFDDELYGETASEDGLCEKCQGSLDLIKKARNIINGEDIDDPRTAKEALRILRTNGLMCGKDHCKKFESGAPINKDPMNNDPISRLNNNLYESRMDSFDMSDDDRTYSSKNNRFVKISDIDDEDEVIDSWDNQDAFDRLIQNVIESGQDVSCPQCGSEAPTLLGPMGDNLIVRCRNCGWDYSLKINNDDGVYSSSNNRFVKVSQSDDQPTDPFEVYLDGSHYNVCDNCKEKINDLARQLFEGTDYSTYIGGEDETLPYEILKQDEKFCGGKNCANPPRSEDYRTDEEKLMDILGEDAPVDDLEDMASTYDDFFNRQQKKPAPGKKLFNPQQPDNDDLKLF